MIGHPPLRQRSKFVGSKLRDKIREVFESVDLIPRLGGGVSAGILGTGPRLVVRVKGHPFVILLNGFPPFVLLLLSAGDGKFDFRRQGRSRSGLEKLGKNPPCARGIAAAAEFLARE